MQSCLPQVAAQMTSNTVTVQTTKTLHSVNPPTTKLTPIRTSQKRTRIKANDTYGFLKVTTSVKRVLQTFTDFAFAAYHYKPIQRVR